MEKGDAWLLVASCFKRWYASFVRYAYGVTGDLALSEDLVQDVYFRLYLQLRQGNVIEKEEGWIFCVLRREIGKQLRKRARFGALHQPLEAVQSPQGLVDPAFSGIVQERSDLGKLLHVLTPREREVVMLRIAALKYREIAEVLGISANSVNTLLARAIRKLRRAAKTRKLKFRFSDDVVPPSA